MDNLIAEKQAHDNFTDGIFSWSRHRRRKRRKQSEAQNGNETPIEDESLDRKENTSTTEEIVKEKRIVTYLILGGSLLIGLILYNQSKERPPFYPLYPFSL